MTLNTSHALLRRILKFAFFSICFFIFFNLSTPSYANTPDLSEIIHNASRTKTITGCEIKISGYSAQEIWAWERLCQGQFVDMSTYNNDKEKNKKDGCNIKNINKWPKSRELSQNFITFLNNYNYKFQTSPLVISCASFNEKITFSDMNISGIIFNKSLFNKDINFYGKMSDTNLKIINSRILKDIFIEPTSINTIFFNNTKIKGNLSLEGIKTNSINIQNSNLGDGIKAGSIRVQNSILIRNTKIQKFRQNLIDGEITYIDEKESQMVFSESEIKGNFIIDSQTKVNGLFLGKKLNIDKSFDIYDSFFDDGFNLEGSIIGMSLEIINSSLKYGEIPYTIINGNLDISNTKFTNLSLSSSVIKGNAIADNIECAGMLNFNGANISKSLFMRNNYQKEKTDKERKKLNIIDLTAIQVGINLEIDHADIKGKLTASSMQIGNHFMLNHSIVPLLNLYKSTVKGDIDLSSSSFKGNLYAEGIIVYGSMLLNKNSDFQEIQLQDAEINNTLNASDSKFGKFSADSLKAGYVFLRRAVFTEEVNFLNAKIKKQLVTNGSTFKRNFNARFIDVGAIYLSGNRQKEKSKFKKIDLNSSQINRHVSIIGANSSELNIDGISIGSDLKLSYSVFLGKVSARNIKVSGSVYLNNNSTFKAVNLYHAEIGGDVDLSSSCFENILNANGIKVSGSMYLNKGSSFQVVQLLNAEIKKSLDASSSIFTGDFLAGRISVGYVYLGRRTVKDKSGITNLGSGAIFNKEVNFVNAKIEKELNTAGSIFDGYFNASFLNTGSLYLSGNNKYKSYFHNINLNSSITKTYVNLTGGEISSLFLNNANIGSELTLSNSSFDGKINGHMIQVGTNLNLTNGDYQNINLTHANIGNILQTKNSKFRKEFNAFGMNANGVYFKKNSIFKNVNLSNANIRTYLWVTGAKFDGHFNAHQIKAGNIILSNNKEDEKTHFTTINASLSDIENDFILRNANLVSLNIKNMKVGKNLDLSSSNFSGSLYAPDLKILGSMYLNKNATFQKVNIRNSYIKNSLDAASSTFSGQFSADSIITGYLFLKNNAVFKDRINLLNSKIEKQLETTGALFEKDFDAINISVGKKATFNGIFKGNLNLNGSNFKSLLSFTSNSTYQNINLISVKVANSINLFGSIVNGSINLTNSKVGDSLKLSSKRNTVMKWGKESKLVLRNTHVENLQDHENSWKVGNRFIRTDLTNFTYNSWITNAVNKDKSLGQRDTDNWLIPWLKSQINHDEHYNPQPYRTLANSLKKYGYTNKAKQILIAMKDNQLNSNETGSFNKIFLYFQKILINYGYNPFKALFWFGGLFLIGLLLELRKSWLVYNSKLSIKVLSQKSLYVLQVITPGIGVDIETKNTWFVYTFRVFGFIILSFLVAGLSGLVK